MDANVYKKYISGNAITDCVVVNSEMMQFALKELPINEDDRRAEEERRTSILSYAPKQLKNTETPSWGLTSWSEGVESIWLEYDHSEKQSISCEINNYVREKNYDDGDFYKLSPIDMYTKGLRAIKNIDGKIYVAGILRKVYKKTGIKTWVDISPEEQNPIMFKAYREVKEKKGNFAGTRGGFSTIDGFTGNDIYAGGERGDLWHYNGKQWQIVDIPGNFNIKTITCGEDGSVYIAGNTGGIIKGRGDHWEVIDPKGGHVFNSSTWFKGKLYLAGDMNGLHVLEGSEIKLYKFPEAGRQQYSFYGGVTSAENSLVSYGDHQALVFDGDKWEEIIGIPALSGSK